MISQDAFTLPPEQACDLSIVTSPHAASDLVTLFLSGDVMTGRGIDQALPHPGDPSLFEFYVQSAQDYVALAESKHGPFQLPLDYAYIWGDALAELDRIAPDVRIINLETSVTTCDDHCVQKGIHYRMHPSNVPCLTAAGIDCCVLANNHVLDWGIRGLEETLDTLRGAGIATAGAGRDLREAMAPAVLEVPAKGRVLVFALGVTSSGIPLDWRAGEQQPGVNVVGRLSQRTVRALADQVHAVKQKGDIVVASIHWGPNWGYLVPREQRRFAHRLIDEAGVDLVHGHSSHHPKGIEVYGNRLILYGCGDLLNDYEGISGFEDFRDDLALMYFPSMDPRDGRLAGLAMSAFQIRRFRLNRASKEDSEWLAERLGREGAALGTRVERGPDGTLLLRWG
ncbi:MAG: CapA family protein [Gemmatimonadetes bacterium]|nr:CapA family protein [Gemmatimonadota bacterium]